MPYVLSDDLYEDILGMLKQYVSNEYAESVIESPELVEVTEVGVFSGRLSKLENPREWIEAATKEVKEDAIRNQ